MQFLHKISTHVLLAVFFWCQVSTVSAQPTLLFVIGDTGECEVEGTARVAAAVRAQPDAASGILIEVGDLAYPTATRERLLACHEPFWGGFNKRLAVPGNHEWRDTGAAGFFSIFPEPVPRKVALGGPWQLILLDSNLQKEAWVAQLKWLDEALAKSHGECLIAAWHHPRWSSGEHGNNPFTQPLWARLQEKVTITLHGHDHHFEALPPLDRSGNPTTNGVPSFIVGNGGATLDSAGRQTRANRSIFGQWGFLRVELGGQEYRWQEIGIDSIVIDNGHGTCRLSERV
jgi:3',5'-cyclic AMP phosphodiesterase CpdA